MAVMERTIRHGSHVRQLNASAHPPPAKTVRIRKSVSLVIHTRAKTSAAAGKIEISSILGYGGIYYDTVPL